MQGLEIGTRRSLGGGGCGFIWRQPSGSPGLIILAAQTFFGGLKNDVVNVVQTTECRHCLPQEATERGNRRRSNDDAHSLEVPYLAYALRVTVPATSQSFRE